MYKYLAGFVGAGNMGGALAIAVCKAVGKENVCISCKSLKKAEATAKNIGCDAYLSDFVAENSKYIFLGIKPQMLKKVYDDLKPNFESNSDGIIVSMLAGVSIKTLEGYFGKQRKIIRIMPNTPCAVGEGVVLVCHNDNVGDTDVDEFLDMMKSTGMVDVIPEGMIDAASAVSGCGPAFVYMFIEALADGGVKCGLPRKNALEYAAKMLSGSAKMVSITNKHPEQLKDEVCSPGGSTIEGVHSLEDGAFRSLVIDAVEAAYLKTKKLG